MAEGFSKKIICATWDFWELTRTGGVSLWTSTLQYGRHAHAPTRTDGDQASALAFFAQLFGKSRDDPRARGAERMAERDAAAIYVHLRAVDGPHRFVATKTLF